MQIEHPLCLLLGCWQISTCPEYSPNSHTLDLLHPSHHSSLPKRFYHTPCTLGCTWCCPNTSTSPQGRWFHCTNPANLWNRKNFQINSNTRKGLICIGLNVLEDFALTGENQQKKPNLCSPGKCQLLVKLDQLKKNSIAISPPSIYPKFPENACWSKEHFLQKRVVRSIHINIVQSFL